MKKPPLTKNERAANGPLPGDLSLYEKELRGCESLSTPGYGGRVYYPTDKGFITLQVRPKARSSS